MTRQSANLFSVSEADKSRLNIMFLAKHACSDGTLHEEDGNHAVYHHEVLKTLRSIGFQVEPRNKFSAIEKGHDFDFIFTLLNRAGFPMSEMLGPLLATKEGIAVLGASPMLRGLGDDKHLAKSVADRCGVPCSPWLVARRGGLPIGPPKFDFEKLVVKPNASSASWGVTTPTEWDEALADIAKLHNEGHDVIVERYHGDWDVVVPVLGGDEPIILPTVRFEMPGNDTAFRSYAEKRGLDDAPKEMLVKVDRPALTAELSDYVQHMLPEFWPFDYGRFEFRYDREREEVVFMEVNLSCNLWSKKTMSGAAGMVGINHAAMMEHIVAYSMDRQGVIEAERTEIDLADT